MIWYETEQDSPYFAVFFRQNMRLSSQPTRKAITAEAIAQPNFKTRVRFCCRELRLNAYPVGCREMTYIFSPLRSEDSS